MATVPRVPTSLSHRRVCRVSKLKNLQFEPEEDLDDLRGELGSEEKASKVETSQCSACSVQKSEPLEPKAALKDITNDPKA